MRLSSPAPAVRAGTSLARRATALAALLWLTGCASPTPDGGFDAVARLSASGTGQAPVHWRDADGQARAQAEAQALLAAPLDADAAVRVALLHHPGLQARYAELGVAEADWVAAGRLANPGFSFGRLQGGGSTEIDRVVLFDVLGLLTLPLAREVETQRWQQAQLQAAEATVAVALEARLAFFEAVAAQQLLAYQAQALEAAELAHELAGRMAAQGHLSQLARLKEQAFLAEVRAQQLRARQQALASRERLWRALGLAAAPTDIRLPDQLPPLPEQLPPTPALEQLALAQRLDVRQARQHTEATARALGLTRVTRFVNVLHAGYQNASASGEPRRNGFEVELRLPLFDTGSSRVARADALYQQALHQAAAVAVQARSEVREADAAYRSSHQLARQYQQELVPLRQRIAEENLLRYNGMLISVFDLLSDARDQVAAVTAAIEAQRDHWLAQSRLQVALTSRSPGGGPTPTGAPAGGRTTAPRAADAH